MANQEDIQVKDAVSVAGSDLTKDEFSVTTESYKEKSYESIPAVHSYQIKPTLLDRFKANPVKEIIRSVHAEVLSGKSYASDRVKNWTIKIANEVNTRCKDLNMKRYKHIVQVIVGELKGAGVKSGVRCLWDSETDGYTSDIFMNDSIFAVTVVFAVYLY